MSHKTGDLDGSQRSAKSNHSFSASVRFDGLVVLNKLSPKTSKKKGIVEMKQEKDNINGNSVGAANGRHQLYRFVDEGQNNSVEELDRSNRRNVTNEWQKNKKEHLSNSYSSAESISSRSSSNDTNHTDQQHRKPSAAGNIATKGPPSLSNGSTTAPSNGNQIPDDDGDNDSPPNEIRNHQLSTTANPINEASAPAAATTTTTATATLPVESSTRKKENKPIKRLGHKSSSSTDLKSSSSSSSTETFLISPKRSSSSSQQSDHTLQTSNRKSPQQQQRTKPKKSKVEFSPKVSFAPKLQVNELLLVNKMHSLDNDNDNDDSDKDDSESSDDNMLRLVRPPAISESRRSSLGGSVASLPGIPELGVADHNETMQNSSRGSIGMGSIKSERTLGNLDSRLTDNGLRGMMKHTKEVQSFYQPTKKICESDVMNIQSLSDIPGGMRTILGGELNEMKAMTVGWRKLPEPWKYKTQKQRLKEKRRKERREAKKLAIRLRRFAERGKYQPLSQSFPVLTQNEQVFLRCRERAGGWRTEMEITTPDLEPLGTLSYTQLTPYERKMKMATGRRVLRDAEGNQCALIFHTLNTNGKSVFRICGPVPRNEQHKSLDGYFVWAEVKNIGEFTPHFRMRVKGDADPQGNSVCFKTKQAGSQWLRCFGSKTKGFSLYCEKEEDGSKLGGCGKISYCGGYRGLSISADMDSGLIICFALVVDEMMENRTR